MVALSYYDVEAISVFTDDPCVLTLMFYDVTLVRKAGNGYVGYKTLFTVSDILAKFLADNDNAVLCFYCDSTHPIKRSHKQLLPQEYRSKLFTKMFDIYMRSGKIKGFINHCVKIADPENPQFAHFICREEHKDSVLALGRLLMEK